MTPNLTPEQREAVERDKRILMDRALRLHAWAKDRKAENRGRHTDVFLEDCEQVSLALIRLEPMLTGPACGKCKGTKKIGDATDLQTGEPWDIPCPDCSGEKE